MNVIMKCLNTGIKFFIPVSAAYCFLEYVADFSKCTGPSMQPTINPNDLVLTDHISVHRKTIKRGDIVVCRSPTNPRGYICKRVVGVQGDLMPYRMTDKDFKHTLHFTSRYIPEGHVLLQGDNQGNSYDSRSYGPVPYGLIRGKVIYKIWPVRDMGVMS